MDGSRTWTVRGDDVHRRYAHLLDRAVVCKVDSGKYTFFFEAPSIISPSSGKPVRLVIDHTTSKDGYTYYIHGLIEQPANIAIGHIAIQLARGVPE